MKERILYVIFLKILRAEIFLQSLRFSSEKI